MLSGLFVVVVSSVATAPAKQNVLFIVSDDLRPEMGVYGGDAISPNLDAFSASAGTVVFNRAYVQQAICCPTRSSFLTGRRPDTTKVWDLKTQFRISGGNFTTLPQTFREHGWYTVGMGKIFHPVQYMNHTDDIAGGSWSAPYYHAQGLGTNMSMCWNENENSQDMFIDNKLAAHGVATLTNVSAQQKATGQPFFVAVGLHRPHLPWDVPEEYYELYTAAGRKPIALADHNQPPVNYNITGAQDWSWDPQSGPRHCGPLKQEGTNLPEYATVPDPVALKFRAGYLAAVSQLDHNFGTVLNALTSLGHVDDTVVVFLGDHGWQLGDLGEFGKKTNFERATRAPLIIRSPHLQHRRQSPEGEVVYADALVEFVDIMPSVIDLAGMAVPETCPEVSTNVLLCTEGSSLRPVMEDPNRSRDSFKDAAFMQYAHCMHDEMIWHDGCNDPSEPKVMGYAIRTRRWRYIEWVKFDKTTTPPTIHWDQLLGTELYDHTDADTDSNVAESVNVVAEPRFAADVKQLSAQLHAGWRA